MTLYPLTFEPIYVPKVWGGNRLATLGRRVPDGKTIGESWELADMAGEAPAQSVVANGPLAGRALHELVEQFGEDLTGRVPLAEAGGFPLLCKYLDAAANLSVQVHPDEAYAARHPGVGVQTESWYVVQADPDAVIYKGVDPDVTPQQFRAAIESGSVEERLIRVAAKPGQTHHLPAGCCHALGAGILVAEIKTPGNTTFRAYDWGRTDRTIHIDQAMQCIRFGPTDDADAERRAEIRGPNTCVTRVVTCDQYRVEEVRMSAGHTQPVEYSEPVVWMVIQGAAELACEHPDCPSVSLGPLTTVLLPPAMPATQLVVSDDVTFLEISFPEALANLIA